MTYENILYDVADGVATITLNQPDKRNALSYPMLDELVKAFERAGAEDDVRCVVLTGAGKVFSAGGDISGFAADVPLAHKHYGTMRFVQLFKTIAELGKPTICRANGHVIAGGLGVALACDLVIASEDAKFSTPEINIGLFPFMIMAIIYRNVPRKKANELLLLGDRLTAQEAVDYGLINKAVPQELLDQAVSEWAAKLAAKAPVVMRLGHDSMINQQDLPYNTALEYLHTQLTLTLGTEDALEGAMAFFEKREPIWKGR
ncbi:MAG: enoyl-CoA hydratase/isomerase family protein [Thermoleophilia bacterium]|nr:enoyl-CoA hydratase/isomerase family protein [Thermoleophilia bacterium]